MSAPGPAESGAVWLDQVRAAIEEALAHPVRAPLDRDVEVLIDLIDRGREELDDPQSLTRATAEGIGGAVFELISMCLVRDSEDDLPGLLPQLMFFATRPYLGVEAALAEFHRSPAEQPIARGRGDP